MLLCLYSTEYHWTILMNVWILVFSIDEQEDSVPWSRFQHTVSILPLGAVNRFPRPRRPIRVPTSLRQNTSWSRISVSPGTDAKHRMGFVVAIEEVDTSLDDDRKNMWKPSIGTFLDARNGVNGRLYANINFVVTRVMEAAKSWRAVYRWWLDLLRRSDWRHEKCTGGRIYLRS